MHLHTKGQFHNAAHFLVFGVLAFLAAGIARTRDQKISNLFFTIVLGFFIEIAQDLKFVLPRNGNWVPVEWTDVLVDSMAVVAVGIVCLGVLPVLQRRMSGGSDADPLLSR